MSFMILDLETVPDETLPPPKDPEKCPPPPYHRIVAAGYVWMADNYAVRQIGALEGPEQEMLQHFSGVYGQRHGSTLVTFNGRGFDVPVLLARCLRYGIPCPWWYSTRETRYRYSAEGHFDLMDWLSEHGASQPVSLDVWAKSIGLPGKMGVDGKDVARLVADGKIAEVRRYAACDAWQEAALFLRVQLLRGALRPKEYERVAEALVQAGKGSMAADAAEATNERYYRIG